MSNPPKVLLFGSFTEGETDSYLNKTPAKTQKSDECKKSQVNIKHTPVLMFGSFGEVQASNVHGDTCSPVIQQDKKKSDIKIFPSPEENGKANDSNHCHPANQNIVDGINLHALHLSDGYISKIDESIKLNGTNNDSTVEAHLKEFSYVPVYDTAVEENLMESLCENKDVPALDSSDMLPRGLTNSGNLCFLNATLQGLLACSPFVQLLQRLRNCNIAKARHPTVASFVEFIAEFDAIGGSNLKKKDVTELETGMPFSPVMFEGVLRKFTPDISSGILRRPRQEDAQEFLSFIMDQMHDELLKLGGQSNLDEKKSSLVSTSEDDGWETVGPKNKTAVTRTQSFAPSELSSIFGGQFQSFVKARGYKPSATVQPFFLLHLDISNDGIRTIEDALHLFSAPETLDEYRPSTTGKVGVVAARKSVNIKALPKVLILHLKRFGYGAHGSTKLHKPVHFPLELVLSRDLLASSTLEGRRYELVSTVTHHGKEASKGHYTANARCPSGHWLRFDDSSVTAISTNRVLHDQAYLLFYKQV